MALAFFMRPRTFSSGWQRCRVQLLHLSWHLIWVPAHWRKLVPTTRWARLHRARQFVAWFIGVMRIQLWRNFIATRSDVWRLMMITAKHNVMYTHTPQYGMAFIAVMRMQRIISLKIHHVIRTAYIREITNTPPHIYVKTMYACLPCVKCTLALMLLDVMLMRMLFTLHHQQCSSVQLNQYLRKYMHFM